MEKINFIFTTFVGQIEHIRSFLTKVNNKKVYIKVFLDDLIFKNSEIEKFIKKGNTFNLKEFLNLKQSCINNNLIEENSHFNLDEKLKVNCENNELNDNHLKVFVGVKNKKQCKTKGGFKNFLESKSGNYFYTKEEYQLYKEKIICDGFFDFETKNIKIGEMEEVEVKTIDEYNFIISQINNNQENIINIEYEEKHKNVDFDKTLLITTDFINEMNDKLYKIKNNMIEKDYSTKNDYEEYLISINETNGKIFYTEENFKMF